MISKEAKRLYDIEYRKNNREAVIRRYKLAKSKQRFGLKIVNTEYLIGKKCSICGMTQEEHLGMYNASLHIHHIDNQGRAAQRQSRQPNNDPENLEILCISCHPAHHGKTTQVYTRERALKTWRTRREKYGANGMSKKGNQ